MSMETSAESLGLTGGYFHWIEVDVLPTRSLYEAPSNDLIALYKSSSDVGRIQPSLFFLFNEKGYNKFQTSVHTQRETETERERERENCEKENFFLFVFYRERSPLLECTNFFSSEEIIFDPASASTSPRPLRSSSSFAKLFIAFIIERYPVQL